MAGKYIIVMRLLVAFLFGLSIWNSVALENAYAADNQTELLNKILRKLEEVDSRFVDIEGRIQKIEGAEAAGLAEDTKQLKEDVEEVFSRLDETEKKTLMDKISFGLSMRTRVDNINWKDKTRRNDAEQVPLAAVKNIEDNNDNVWSNRFRFRMLANVTDNVKFYGRMSVNKYWSDVDYPASTWEANFSERYTDTTVRLDRAYVDLLFRDELPIPLALTVGRQPTVGGTPLHLKDDTAARSTYPALMFQREIDGICATFGLSKWTQLEQSAFRVMYGKFLQPDNDDAFYLDDKGDDVDMLWLQAESRLPRKLRDTTATLTYIRNWNMPGFPFEYISKQEGDLGYNDSYGLSLVSENLFNLGLELFFSYGRSKAHSSGETVNVIRADFNGDGAINNEDIETWHHLRQTGVTRLADGTTQVGTSPYVARGLLSNDGKGDFEGEAYLIGARYTLPFSFLREPKIGLEYNKGSRYWWVPQAGEDSPFDKLAVRGHAWELYYIQPIVEHVMVRLGMLDIHYDHHTILTPIGNPFPVDRQLRNYSMVLDVNF